MTLLRTWLTPLSLSVTLLCPAVHADTTTSAGDRGGEGSTPFTGLAQTPEASLFTGALTTSIPIMLPAGRKNVTPRLALAYSSNGGPSPFGFGWDLPLGTIRRSTKWGVPRPCDTSNPHADDFVLSMPNGTAELVHDPPGSDIYRPTVEESSVEVKWDGGTNTWTVYDRSGLKYVFGDATSARVGNDVSASAPRGDAAGFCSFTTAWALTHIEDPNGNAADIDYLALNNVLYPAHVKYGGNTRTGLAHVYEVRFAYEQRPDAIENDLSGVAATLGLRLNAIRVYFLAPALTDVRTYTFSYDAGANGQDGYQSVLSSVTVLGADGQAAYPTQVFSYEGGMAGLGAASALGPQPASALRVSDANGSVSQTVMDMDGDGIVDLVVAAANAWTIYRGTGTGFATTGLSWSLPVPSLMGPIRSVQRNGATYATDRDTFDINGDGIPDFVDAHASASWTVYLGGYVQGRGWGFGSPQAWNANAILSTRVDRTRTGVAPGDNAASITETVQDVLDINGDGLPDLIVAGSTRWQVYFNTRTGFATRAASYPAPTQNIRQQEALYAGTLKGTAYDLMDFNGDGLVDMVVNPQDHSCTSLPDTGVGQIAACLNAYLNTGQGFATVPLLSLVPSGPFIRWTRTAPSDDADLFDVNGDGLPDLVCHGWNCGGNPGEPGVAWNEGGSDLWYVFLNTGGRLESTLVYSEYVAPAYRPISLLQWPGGAGPFRRVAGAASATTTIDMLDVNGDGMLDRVDTSHTPWTVQLNTHPYRPNVLTSMRNGLGGVTAMEYVPSTVFDNTGGDGVSDLPFTTWVVGHISQSDGLGTSAQHPALDQQPMLVTFYGYDGGRYDPASHEFRGFRTVNATSGDGNTEVTTFGQADATKGKVLQVDTYAGAPASSHRVRSAMNQWHAAAVGNGRTQLWLSENAVIDYDLSTAPAAFIATLNDPPDQYGNLLHTKKCSLWCADHVDTWVSYATPSANGHVRDKPAYTHSEAAAATRAFDEKWFFYDGQRFGTVGSGNLTKTESSLDTWKIPPPPCSGDASKRCLRTTMAYDTYGNLTAVTDALGNVNQTVFAAPWFLYPFQVTNALGHATVTATDYRWGTPQRVTDPNGAITSYAYDSAGRLSAVARPGDSLASPSVTYSYRFGTGATSTAHGTLSSVKVERKEPNNSAASGWMTTAGYVPSADYFDALGRRRLSATFRVVGTTAQTVIRNLVDYDAGGRVATRYDPYPTTSAMPSDQALSTLALLDTPNNGGTTYDYLLNGSAANDPRGRIHQVTNTDGTTRRTEYRGVTTTLFDEENHQRVTTADWLGRVVTQEVYTGNGGTAPYALYASTASAYDGAGRVTATTQNGNEHTTVAITYDSLGRKVQMTDPDTGAGTSAGIWRYGYDLNGNLIYQDDPRPLQHVQFCYDALNRVTKKFELSGDTWQTIDCASATSGLTVTYAYDTPPSRTVEPAWPGFPIGRAGSVTDPSGSTTFLYDARGRITVTSKTITVVAPFKTARTATSYDTSAADHIVDVTYPDGERVRSTYDRSGQVITLTRVSPDTYPYITAVTYDVLGRATTIGHGSSLGDSYGVTDTRTYYGQPDDGLFPKGHRLSNLRTLGPLSTTYLNLNYLLYSPRGLLKQVADVRYATGSVLSGGGKYGYDDLGRLTTASYTYEPPGTTHGFGYDNYGNLTSKDQQAYGYDSDSGHPHQPAAVGSTPMAYDANGNLTMGRDGQAYAYDANDHLTGVAAGAARVSFVYDYTGHRVAKQDSNGWTWYYGALAEGTGQWLTKYYYLGGMLVASNRVGTTTTLASLEIPSPIQLAGLLTGRSWVLVVGLQPVAQRVMGLLVVGGGALLLVAMRGRRRRAVVGVVLRRGHVLLVVFAFGLTSLPLPIVVRPASAAVSGTPSSSDSCVPPTPRPTPTPPGGAVTIGVLHYHSDHLGSPQVVTTDAGTVHKHLRYTAYGERRYDSGAGCGVDRYCHEFTGYDTEPVSGLEYAGARFYDPTLAMFLTHDPARQFANPYSYGAGDPVNGTDPTGALFGIDDAIVAWVVAGLLIGGAIASGIQAGIRSGDPGAGFTAAGESLLLATASAGGLGAVGAQLESVATYGASFKLAFDAALVGAGGYATYEAYRHGDYAGASFGVVSLVVGLEGLANDTQKVGAQPSRPTHGTNGPGRFISDEDRSTWERAQLEPVQATQRTPRNQGNLAGLDPEFRGRVERVLEGLEDQGYNPRVASGLRTPEQQRAAYEAGNSPSPNRSAHLTGRGADIVDRRILYSNNRQERFWQLLRQAAETEHLTSGSSFPRWDPSHVEMPGWEGIQ